MTDMPLPDDLQKIADEVKESQEQYDCRDFKDLYLEGIDEAEVIQRMFAHAKIGNTDLHRLGLPGTGVEYDGLMHESFADGDATYFLDKLARQEPFTINRIGEAHFTSAVYRAPLRDCQQERMHYAAVPVVEYILRYMREPDYHLTITMAMRSPDFRFCTVKAMQKWDEWGLREYPLCNHQMLLGEAMRDGLERFFTATQGAIVIGPPRYEEHRSWIKYSHLVRTRPVNCGIFYKYALDEARALLSTLPDGQVVLVAAANASPLIIQGLYETVGPQHTYWNVGSIYDMPINLVFDQHNDDFQRRWGHVPQVHAGLFDWMTLG